MTAFEALLNPLTPPYFRAILPIRLIIGISKSEGIKP
jgi:hypothetical protein